MLKTAKLLSAKYEKWVRDVKNLPAWNSVYFLFADVKYDTGSPLTLFFFCISLSAGVVSVSFEEDEEGNLCLIAYPLHSELGDLENVDPSADLEPKNKMKWVSKMLLDNEGYSKDRSRNSRKEKDKR